MSLSGATRGPDARGPDARGPDARGPETKPRGPRRWLVWAVLVPSLALNLLIFGTLAGAALSWRLGAPGISPPPPGDAGMVAYLQTLPAERRAESRQIVRGKRDVLMPLRQEVRRARIASQRALLADPFDAEAYRRALEHVLEAETAQRKAQIEVLVAVAGRLTPSERRNFISWRNIIRQNRGLPNDDEEARPPVPPKSPQ